MRDATILLGHYSLVLALIAAGWATISALMGAVTRGRGLQYSAERGVWGGAASSIVARIRSRSPRGVRCSWRKDFSCRWRRRSRAISA